MFDEVADVLRKVLGGGSIANHHVFTPAADVPDDFELRLVVLSPNTSWTRGAGPNPARDAAAAILKDRGGQPRVKQNRLLFLAADADQVSHLKETVRALLAWRSIDADFNDTRITLDNIQAKQVKQNKEQTHETVKRLVRDTFKWLVVPSQTVDKKTGVVKDIEWEAQALNPAAPYLGKEIDRVLVENEWVINEWAPVNLHYLLKQWFWKDGAVEVKALDVWQKSCSYLYLPRLAKSTVLQNAIAAGAPNRDYFGLASGQEGDNYLGFTYGVATSPFMDVALLIEPGKAAAYEEATRPKPVEPTPTAAGTETTTPTATVEGRGTTDPAATTTTPPASKPTHFYAIADIDPNGTPAIQFSKVINELVELFTLKPGTQVRIKVDIEATSAEGFDETTVRAAKENSRVLNIRTADFD